VPFWIGYVVSLVGCFVLMAGLDILDLDDHLGFWVYVCVAFGVVAPFGGVILQVAHHVFWRCGRANSGSGTLRSSLPSSLRVL